MPLSPSKVSQFRQYILCFSSVIVLIQAEECGLWEEYTCPKGLLMVNWLKFITRVSQPLFTKAPNAHCTSVRLQMGCQASCAVFLSAELILIRELPGSKFDQLDWDFPCPIIVSQLYLHLHLYQPFLAGQCFLDQSNVRIWSPHLHEKGPVRDQGCKLLYVSQLHFCLSGARFQFPLKSVFPGLWNQDFLHRLPLLSHFRTVLLQEWAESRVFPQLSYITVEMFSVNKIFPHHHTSNWSLLLALNWWWWSIGDSSNHLVIVELGRS